MKKVFSLLLSLTMVMALLAGCGGDTTADDTTDDTASNDAAQEETAEAERHCGHRRLHLHGGGHRRPG